MIGLTVYVTLPQTVREGIELMRDLAAMTCTLNGARSFIEGAEAALAEVTTFCETSTTVRVFCPIWRSPWMTVGPHTYMHDFITVCGGCNIFADRWERYPRVDLSEMAYRDPEVILLPDEPFHFRPKHLSELQTYPNISAVRLGRIYLLDGKHLCWYGPRIASSLRYVQRLLYMQQK